MIRCDVVIIGAGSVGTPLALSLVKRGYSVHVVEKEASWGRGQNRAAIGGIRATHSDGGKISVCLKSLEIFEKLQAEHDIGFTRGGYLFVAYNEERERALKNLLTTQRKFSLPIDWVNAEKVNELAPGINVQGLRGGSYGHRDGYASPLKAGNLFYKLAKEKGAVFHFNEMVTELVTEDHKITKVVTDKESYSANLVVNASGADAARVAALSGLDLPVRPDMHEAGVTEPVERFFMPMIVDTLSDVHSSNYYFYQAETGQIIFCITPKPQAFGTSIHSTSSFLSECARRMCTLYPRLQNIKVRRIWRGLYPMTEDGTPIVDFAPEAENFLQATGMCGQGFMIGPGLGEIIADRLESKSAHEEVFSDFSLQRSFKGVEALK